MADSVLTENMDLLAKKKNLAHQLAMAVSRVNYNLFGVRETSQSIAKISEQMIEYLYHDELDGIPVDIGKKLADLHFIQPDLLGQLQAQSYAAIFNNLTLEEQHTILPKWIKLIALVSNRYTENIIKNLSKQQEQNRRLSADRYQKSQKEFNELYENLDRMVQQRTDALAEANERLQKEIAEKEKSRKSLRASEERYRLLSESSQDLIFIFSKKCQIRYMNHYASKVIGKNIDNCIGEELDNLFTLEDKNAFEKVFRQVVQKNKPGRFQHYIILKNNIRLYWDMHLVPITDANGEHVILVISRDLTKEKQSEMEIIRREHKYHTLFDSMQDGILLINDYEILDCNPASLLILQKEKSELLGLPFIDLGNNNGDKATRGPLKLYFDLCRKGHKSNFEWLYTQKDGNVAHLEVKMTTFSDSGEWRALVVLRDITATQKAHKALIASESRFRDIIERSLDGYYFMNTDYQLAMLNAAAEKIIDYNLSQVNRIVKFLLKKNVNSQLVRIAKRAMSGDPVFHEEIEITGTHPKLLAVSARRVYQQGRVTGIEGFVKDLTARKKAEDELRRSEARHWVLFEKIPYDVFGISTEHVFIRTNKNFQENWGNYEGDSVADLKPVMLSNVLIELCGEIENGMEHHERTVTLSRAGENRHYRIIMAPIITNTEEMIGFVGLLIDITDTVNAMNAKQTFASQIVENSESIRESIAKEIHDSLGQMLFAMQLDLGAVKGTALNNIEKLDDLVSHTQLTLSKAMKEASDICYRLRPRLLEDFGTIAALEDLIETSNRSSEIHIQFEHEVSQEFEKNTATAVYRVSQEALSNILKHSNAKNAKIQLNSSEGVVNLTISDDGTGFNQKHINKKGRHGFGLMNMSERIEMLGGTFSIQSSREGTVIKASIPVTEKNNEKN